MRSRYIIAATLSKEFALIARPHVVGTLIWEEKLNSLVFPSIPKSHLLPERVLGFLHVQKAVLATRITEPSGMGRSETFKQMMGTLRTDIILLYILSKAKRKIRCTTSRPRG